MDRMSVMDASFLYSDDGRSHNDVGMVLVFDGPAVTREELMQAVADRIALVPRFRQRVKHMPMNAALPVWMDDTNFDMGRHVHHHPAPPSPDPVGAAVSRVMSGSMDLTIPLWQMHLVTGLPEDRWLLLIRMHHAMVDGQHSTEIVRLLLSPKPEGAPPVLDTWRARPEVPDATLLASLATDGFKEATKMATDLAMGKVRLPKMPETFDPSPFMQPGIPISSVAVNGQVETGRHYGMIDVELAALKQVRAGLGGTINDLMLAACGHGYASVIAEYLNEPVNGRTMRVLVPVSLRSAESDHADAGNEIGAMVVEVPLGGISTTDRLARIRQQTEAFKSLKNAVPANTINPGSSMASPLTLMMGTRMAAVAPTLVNTVITNVPGPQTPLYLKGRRLYRLGACIALWSPLKIAISMMSYNGIVTVSAVTDEATFPTVTPLLDAIRDGFDELMAAAGVTA